MPKNGRLEKYCSLQWPSWLTRVHVGSRTRPFSKSEDTVTRAFSLVDDPEPIKSQNAEGSHQSWGLPWHPQLNPPPWKVLLWIEPWWVQKEKQWLGSKLRRWVGCHTSNCQPYWQTPSKRRLSLIVSLFSLPSRIQRNRALISDPLSQLLPRNTLCFSEKTLVHLSQ